MLERHLDLNDPALVADPYPVLAALREEAPVFYDPIWNKVFVSRYADIASLLRDRRLGRSILHAYSRDELGWPPPDPRLAAFDHFQANHLLDMEPPGHTRLRRLVGGAFTARRVAALRPGIEAVVDRLLDDMAAREAAGATADLVTDLAEPLPVAVIAQLLGVPEADRRRLRPWSAAIVRLYELGYSDDEVREADTAVHEFGDYLRTLAAEREAAPGDDLVSALVHARDEGDRLSMDELVANCILLLNAGHEASVNGLSLGVLTLLGNPTELARLVESAASGDEELARSAVEELLRFSSPLPMFERWVLEEVEVGGHRLRPGTEVALLYASGNRDPRRFPEPDRLDLSRADNAHLTFGLGTHYCLGAPLARLELSLALARLFARFPFLTAAGEAAFGPGFVIRGLRSLPVRLGNSPRPG